MFVNLVSNVDDKSFFLEGNIGKLITFFTSCFKFLSDRKTNFLYF